MEVEGIDSNHQLVDENTNGIDGASKDGVEISMNDDNDANMMTLHVWDEDDTEDSAKESKTDDSNFSREGMMKDVQELENTEEEVKKYYVVEEDTMDEEEKLSSEQNEDMEHDDTGTNMLKRKAEDNFEGFDVDPYDVFEIKQIAKRIKNECVSESDKREKDDKKEIKTEENDKKKNISVKKELILDNYVNSSSTKNADEYNNSEILNDEKTQQNNENEVKDIDKKIAQTDSPSNVKDQRHQISKSSPSRHEIYHKPLEMGWKRELVYRAQPSSSRDKGEAYYITPSGKKLRTKGEIMQHLIPGSGLSIDNFTFTREPLGFSPDEEIVRIAKLTKTTGGIDPALLDRKLSVDSNLGKRTPKPKAPKGASPPPQGWTPAKAVKASSVTNSPRSVTQAKSLEEDKTNKSTPKSVKQTKKNVPTDSPGSASLTTGDDTTPGRKKIISARHKLPSSDNLLAAATNQQATTTVLHRSSFESFTTNFFGNVSTGYDILLHTFQYLKVQELLRAACVCRMWNVVANHRSLWKTVRMKNSQINNWTGLTAVLKRNETKHLDLRKMLISNTNGDEMWSSFSNNIQNVTSLEAIDLCRCSSKIIENLFLSNSNLKILNAVSIKDDQLNLENLYNLKDLQELRLKSIDCCALDGNLTSFKHLTNLKHLSLTSFRELGTKQISTLGELINLETLELGECTEFNMEFVTDVLPNLMKLERLRLEKAQEPCCTLNILQAIAKLPLLTQLELVNFDVKAGFDEKLSQCKNLKKLLLIPTYVSQSATTNNIVLKALLNLSDTLRTLTWVVTLELLRVTALYVVQCDDKKKDNKVFDESIPVLKPVPNSNSSSIIISSSSSSSSSGGGGGGSSTGVGIGAGGVSINDENNEQKTQKPTTGVPQVEILPLSKIEKILSTGMPDTKFKILKVPYHATWRQNLIEMQ